MKEKSWKARANLGGETIAACEAGTKRSALLGLRFFVMRWAEEGVHRSADAAWKQCEKICTFTAKKLEDFVA